MERVEGKTKERFTFVEEFEEEMSQHSSVCIVTRLKKTVDRVEEEEKMME